MLLNLIIQKQNPIIQLLLKKIKNPKEILPLDPKKINYSKKGSKLLKSQN